MSPGASIAIENGRFSYAHAATPLFSGLDFSVSSSDRIGLTGQNGTGKTTLFYLLTGLVLLQGGRVVFNGEGVMNEKDFRRVRASVGLLFQNSEDQLFSPTVLEDVAFGPLNMGMSSIDAEKKARETLDMLDMSDYAGRLSHRLSGGEKKLVALATILSMEPKILLLDEPTNDLDPETRHRLVGILNHLSTGLVVISHDWDFLDMTVNRLMELADGKVTSLEREDLHVHRHVHRGGRVMHEHDVV